MRKRDPEKVQVVRAMRLEGKKVAEIADVLQMSKCGVQAIIKQYDIPLVETYVNGVCEWCGRQFTYNKTKNGNQRFCSTECQRKFSRKIVRNCNEDIARKMVERIGDEWEYVDGYTGSDGFMNIRHKPCGTVIRKSCVSIRKSITAKCDCCIEKKRHDELTQKEIKRFNRPIKKFKQEEMKECAVCGALFIGRRTKYCSHECGRVVANRYASDAKERKRKMARTSQSSEITVKKIYDRDNGICMICGGKCDINADGNDNNYPSIDHIIPISLGGKDELSNVRLAHRICNSMRGNSLVYTPTLAEIRG